jgi:hypothetical protein
MIEKMLSVILMCCILFGCGKTPSPAGVNEEALGEINTKIDVLTAEIARQKDEGVQIKSLPSLGFIFKWTMLGIIPTIGLQVATLFICAKLLN